MRLHFAVLAVAATLLSVANADSTSTNDHKAAVVVGADHGNARLLRTVETESEDDASDEDRLYLPGLETVSKYVWSLSGSKVTSKTINGWLKKGETADDVFFLLKLDKAGDNLLSSPKLQSWLTYAEEFNRRNPGNEATMFNTFRKAYGDAELAKILQTAKGVKETESLAKALQVQQFKQWINEGLTPQDVFSSVFRLSTNWRSDPAAIIVHQFNQFYRSMKKVKVRAVAAAAARRG